jgi:hypothetical protein
MGTDSAFCEAGTEYFHITKKKKALFMNLKYFNPFSIPLKRAETHLYLSSK